MGIFVQQELPSEMFDLKLQEVADTLEVKRIGPQHQVGFVLSLGQVGIELILFYRLALTLFSPAEPSLP